MPNNPIALELIRESKLPIAAPSANKFGHVSPSKAEHVYDDFHKDSEVTILDGGPCSFGIESTVLKINQQPQALNEFELLILRKGGVSEKALYESMEGIKDRFKVTIISKKHNDFKKETEKLEGPGQFLRHYAPNIDTFLFDGQNGDQILDQAVLIDFCGVLSHLQDKAMHYVDMCPKAVSEDGKDSFTEAVSNIYEVLRWSETREDAKIVLIADLMELAEKIDQ